jgi:FtsP/CotA-like multicopper oxidase with cupredoxin domain
LGAKRKENLQIKIKSFFKMSRELQPIVWHDQHFINDIQQRVVEIDGKLCQVFATGKHQPGTFGLRLRVGKTGTVLLKNHLPYEGKNCVCDADLLMAPEAAQNPCWTNQHFHGLWSNGKEDDVYACVKPGEEKLYRYSIAKCHPTQGLLIIHPHNFNASDFQENITTFPVQLYNPKKPDYPLERIQEFLNIQVAYMQPCKDAVKSMTTGSGGKDAAMGCELKVFNYPRYANKPNFGDKIRQSIKLVLTNGASSPFKLFPVKVPIILRIAYSGLDDLMNLIILDDLGHRIPYRLLSVDSMPNPDDKQITEFLAAHMQRLDIEFTLERPTQYRLVKFVSEEEFKDNPFSTGTRVLLFMNADSATEKALIKPMPLKRTNCWIRNVNKKFRHYENVAAWRTVLFNNPMFPDMQGATFDVHTNQVVMSANHSEVWLIGALGGIHSFHIHLMWYVIMSERDGPEGEWKVIPREKQRFQDTLTIVGPQQYLIWLFPFADKRLPPNRRATGRAMTHCHRSEHADQMMMLSLLVDPREDTKPSGVGLQPGPQSREIKRIVKKSSTPSRSNTRPSHKLRICQTVD